MNQMNQNNSKNKTPGSQLQSNQADQLSEQDILQLALNENKHLAASLNTYILEASNEQLSRDYMTVLGDVYSQNKMVYDLIQQKGFYDVQNANPQEIN